MTTRPLTASCHCGAFKLATTLDAATLPQPHTYCHCTSCRRRTGQLAVVPVNLSDYEPTAEVLAPLKRYTTKRGLNPVTTHFCRTCGAKVFWEIKSQTTGESRWGVSLGLIEGDINGLVDMKGHSWVGDTKDGGLADMMLPADTPRYNEEDGALFVPAKPETPSNEKYLPLHCDCADFSVYISRPAPTLPLPRGCYWYRPPFEESTGLPTRFMATFCACDSCRVISGSTLPAHPWVQVPFVDISVKDALRGAMQPFGEFVQEHNKVGASVPTTSRADGAVAGEEHKAKEPPVITLGTDIPGLTRYNSSPSIARYHCSGCGATVLYYDPDRAFLGTWAAGLVDSEEGARAESWLSWWTGQDGHPVGAMHRVEEAEKRDPETTRKLKEGLETWGKKVGQRK